MNLSKRELMEQMWISVVDRFPDSSIHPNILMFHERTGLVRQPMTCFIDRDVQYTKDIMSGKQARPKDTISGCEFTHWMPIYTPPTISRRRS